MTTDRRPRLPVWAIVVVAAVVGTGVNRLSPEPATTQQPFLRTAEVGSPIDVRAFSATVLGVRTTESVNAGTSFAATSGRLTTGGAWVLVRVRAEGMSKPGIVGYAAVVDVRGRTFLASTRLTQPLLLRSLQPGLPVEADIVFEVPADALGLLRVRLSPATFDQRLDAMTDVVIEAPRPSPRPLTPAALELVTR